MALNRRAFLASLLSPFVPQSARRETIFELFGRKRQNALDEINRITLEALRGPLALEFEKAMRPTPFFLALDGIYRGGERISSPIQYVEDATCDEFLGEIP